MMMDLTKERINEIILQKALEQDRLLSSYYPTSGLSEKDIKMIIEAEKEHQLNR